MDSFEDVSILEIDELCTYIKKTKNGEEFTFIWIAVDRNKGKVIDFEIGDKSKSTYLYKSG